MIRGSLILLIVGPGRGPTTKQFGGIWRYFSTSRLKIGRLKDGLTIGSFSSEATICVFKQIADQINSTQIAKMFCGRCLVTLIITFWRRIFLHKCNYFLSFGAGNCVSNSSFKWVKNSPEQFGSIRVNNIIIKFTIILSNKDRTTENGGLHLG